VASAQHRLLLVSIDGGSTGPALAQRRLQRAGLDDLRRLVLTSSAVGFIRARSAAVTMPRVSGVRRMCSESTSLSAKKLSRLSAMT
jgi:hypothetical protein